MQSLSRTFQNLCFVMNMNINRSWMKNRINPQVFILFNFFLHLSMRFPNNHPPRLPSIPFIDFPSIAFFDPKRSCCSNDRKCFRSKRRDKLRLRCNMELILVCMFPKFLWSNQFLPEDPSTCRPSPFTSPFPFQNPFCPFLRDFCTMRPLWIRFPYVYFLQDKIIFYQFVIVVSGNYKIIVKTRMIRK